MEQHLNHLVFLAVEAAVVLWLGFLIVAVLAALVAVLRVGVRELCRTMTCRATGKNMENPPKGDI